MFVWLKHETGLISSTTVFEKDKKKKEGKEEKLKDAWRKVGPFDHGAGGSKKKKKKGRTGNYKSSFESHGVASFCNDKKHR